MLVAQYEVGLDDSGTVLMIAVNNVMLQDSTVLTCDLDYRIKGSNLILGLAFNEDIEQGCSVPYEWIMLPGLSDPVVADLLDGARVPLVEETTGEVFRLSLDNIQEKQTAVI